MKNFTYFAFFSAEWSSSTNSTQFTKEFLTTSLTKNHKVVYFQSIFFWISSYKEIKYVLPDNRPIDGWRAKWRLRNKSLRSRPWKKSRSLWPLHLNRTTHWSWTLTSKWETRKKLPVENAELWPSLCASLHQGQKA